MGGGFRGGKVMSEAPVAGGGGEGGGSDTGSISGPGISHSKITESTRACKVFNFGAFFQFSERVGRCHALTYLFKLCQWCGGHQGAGLAVGVCLYADKTPV
jgi:hypothetical protein